MDIQVSSNFERLLFEMNGRDGGMTAEQLQRFRATGRAAASRPTSARVRSTARSAPAGVDDAATLDEIARTFTRRSGCSIDPHTAVGDRRRRAALGARGDGRPVVTLATAHPAKFPDAVERATGVRPELPPHLADLFERPERTSTLAERPRRRRDVRRRVAR